LIQQDDAFVVLHIRSGLVLSKTLTIAIMHVSLNIRIPGGGVTAKILQAGQSSVPVQLLSEIARAQRW